VQKEALLFPIIVSWTGSRRSCVASGQDRNDETGN